MTRKLKRLGAAALAALALSAVMAAAAQAAEWTATNKSYPLVATGGQTSTFEFKMGPRQVTCKEVHFEGSITAKSKELVVTPKYTNCKANGGLGATFTVNGCTHVFTAPMAGGEFELKCISLEQLEIDIYASESAEGEGKAPVCKIIISPQGPLPGITWSNEGIGNTEKVKGVFNAVKPKYTTTGDQKVCGTGGTGEILGTTTLTGLVGGTAEGLMVG